jgi:hypothetical protein
MNHSSVLIVTYGRTGSTLLMGVLNAIPGVLVRGENMNLCLGLFAALESLRVARQQHGHDAQDSTKPFFGAERLDESAFLADARAMLRRQLVPAERTDVRCWGFKEIRYTPAALRKGVAPGLPQYLDFLAALMPAPAFVFLTRDHAQVLDSAFWKNREESEAVSAIAAFEEKARKWSQGRKDCFWIDYAAMIAGPRRLQSLFDFLGAEYDERAVAAVMSREHSYAGKPENLKGVATRRQQSRAEAQPRRKPARSAVKVRPPAIVAHLATELKIRDAGSGARLGGALVLVAEQPAGARLTLEARGAVREVEWGLPSPRVASRFPGNPHAAAARFRIDLERVDGDEVLVLHAADGERHPLGAVGARAYASATVRAGGKAKGKGRARGKGRPR